MTSPKNTSRDTPKGELRRKQLLDAATECFREEGIHGCSISRISRASGMSPGHIYHYFENKEAIVEAIAERERHDMLGLLERIQVAASEDGGPLYRIEHARELVARGADPAQAALSLELAAESARNPAVAKIMQRMDSGITDRFVELIARVGGASSSLTTEQLRHRIDFIALVVNGLPLRAQTNPDMDREAMSALMVEVFRFLMSGGDAGAGKPGS